VLKSRLAASARGAVLTALAALLILWQLRDGRNAAFFGDFRAFYCAAHALVQGANPYAASSLYACERMPEPFGLARAFAGMVIPAPLPGYAILVFVPLSALTYPAACVAWLAILLVCLALSACALGILLNKPADVMLWTIATGAAVVSLPPGELGMPMLAGLLWMAVALRRGLWAFAGIAGMLAMLEPHVALPAMLGAYVLIPQMRKPVFLAAAALIALDVACGGLDAALSYFADVLPAHAQSEVANSLQYSMTWALHGLRFSDRSAIAGGTASYVFMTLAGILTAHLLQRRTNDLAFAALIPPAYAVLGGTFMHYTQIVAAIPAALLLFEHTSAQRRHIFAAAFLLLVIPWLWMLSNPLLVPVYVAVCAGLAFLALRYTAAASLRIALGAALLCGIVIGAGGYFGASLTHTHAEIGGTLAQASWSQFVNARFASSGAAWWIAKAPTWAGLLSLVLGCTAALTRPRALLVTAPAQ
jgi:hypothetical protein